MDAGAGGGVSDDGLLSLEDEPPHPVRIRAITNDENKAIIFFTQPSVID